MINIFDPAHGDGRGDAGRTYAREVGAVVAFVLVLGGFAAIVGGLAWLSNRTRRRSLGSAFLGPLDEIYNPAAHRARIEIHEQSEHAAALPAADDTPRPAGQPPESTRPDHPNHADHNRGHQRQDLDHRPKRRR